MHSWLQIWLLVMLVLFLVQLLLMMIDLRLWLRKGCYDLLNVVIVMKCRIHDWSYWWWWQHYVVVVLRVHFLLASKSHPIVVNGIFSDSLIGSPKIFALICGL